VPSPVTPARPGELSRRVLIAETEPVTERVRVREMMYRRITQLGKSQNESPLFYITVAH